MAIFLASLNGRGLRNESKQSQLIRTLQHLDVNICCLQETHFIPSDYLNVLTKRYDLFSAYFDSHSRGVSWLISHSLKATCSLVFADPAGRICVVDITIKEDTFRLIGVYAPNCQAERISFFQRIDPFVTSSKRVVLAGDWNAVLDPSIDREGNRGPNTNNLDVIPFRDLIDRVDLVDKFRNEHPNKIVWTWTNRGSSNVQHSSYIDRVLIKRVDVGFLECPSFHSVVYSDHRLVRVRMILGKAKPRMTGYWKLNTSLFDEKDFQDQLSLMIMRELTGSVFGNKFWGGLKNKIRSFAADYSRRLNRENLAAQAAIEFSVEEAVRRGDPDSVNIAKAELASLLIKKDQALVVRARLNRMSPEATNMAAELRLEELRSASNRHIASVTSPDGRQVTTDKGICEEFRSYFQDLFTREPGLSSAQFDTYLADFPCLEATESAGCEGHITEAEIREAISNVGTEKTPGIDGLPYELYLRLSPIYVHLLAILYNHWLKQGNIPQRFTKGVVKLLRKDKDGGDGIDNFRPITLLNTELKILAKVLSNRLQTVLASLIGPEQTCSVKGRTIQDNLHLVRTIIENVDSGAALIKLDQSKAFDRVDHHFLESILSAAGFGQDFRSWIRLLYASPSSMVEVNGIMSSSFKLSRSVRQGCPLSPMLYILALEPFLRKLKANPVLRGITLPGANTSARYTAYVDDVTLLVTSFAEIWEVDSEIQRYRMVAGAKINCSKSAGLLLGSWRGGSIPGPFDWTDGPCKILGVWYGPDLQLEKNWSEVLEKVVAAVGLWLRRHLSLKGRAEVCVSHIYPIIVYRLSVLPLPCTDQLRLEQALFALLWGSKQPVVRREICQLHPSEGGLGMPNITIRQHTLRLNFLDRMCSQDEENGKFWKENAKKAFPALRSVHSDEGETRRLPRKECSFYRECRRALKVFSRVAEGLSDAQPLSRKALYRLLVRGSVRDDLIETLGLTKWEARLIWPWTPGLKCLNNNEASLTWLVIRNGLWVAKRSFAAGLVDSPECVRCGDMEESIEHAFYHCSTVHPLCELIEGYMVRILKTTFFALDASAVCSNVVASLEKTDHYVLLCLLGILRMVAWTTRQKRVHEGERFTPVQLVSYFKHQLKVKIRAERRALSSMQFSERWVKVARMCRIKRAEIEWHIDL